MERVLSGQARLLVEETRERQGYHPQTMGWTSGVRKGNLDGWHAADLVSSEVLRLLIA